MPDTVRILMIGADLPALESLHDIDAEVTVLFGATTKDTGLPLPDGTRTVFVDDHRNVDCAITGLIRAGFGLGSFDVVYAHDEVALMAASVLGRLWGAKALPVAVVARFRDKYLQKQLLRAAGIPVAAHRLIPDIRDLADDYQLAFERGVLKPIAGQATQSTYLVNSTADVLKASRECRQRNVSTRTYVVEQFVTGEEWFADGIVSGGRLRFVSLGRYAQNCLAAVTERAPVRTYCLDPVIDKLQYQQATPVVEQALSVLGLTDGIFHMELFCDNDTGDTGDNGDTGTIWFSECAARRAGGPIRDQIRYKFGVDLAFYGVAAQLGELTTIPATVRDGVVASAFLPIAPGVLLDHPAVTELVAQPDVVHARIFVPRGIRAPGLGGNTFGRMGEFTVHCADLASADQRLDQVSQWFAERVVTYPYEPSLRELWGHPRNAGFVHAASAAVSASAQTKE